MDESGGIKYAEKKLNLFSEKAIDSIKKYPESDVKNSLINIVSFNINRSK